MQTASCSAKLAFSLLTSLTDSSFSKKHFGQLSLNTNQLSDFTQGYFSPRMVRRQLNQLAAAYPALYQERRRGKVNFIKIGHAAKSQNFKIIFLLGSHPKLQAPSIILLTSLLLDKAAFNYRCGEKFAVLSSQLKQLAAEIGISQRSLINHLRTLQELNLIVSLTGRQGLTGTELQKQGFKFSEKMLAQYQKLVNLQPSCRCKKLAERRSYKVKNNQIMRGDAAKYTCIDVNRQSHIQRFAGFAEKPNPIAEAPRLHAQNIRDKKDYCCPNSIDAAIAALKFMCEDSQFRQQDAVAEFSPIALPTDTQFPTGDGFAKELFSHGG